MPLSSADCRFFVIGGIEALHDRDRRPRARRNRQCAPGCSRAGVALGVALEDRPPDVGSGQAAFLLNDVRHLMSENMLSLRCVRRVLPRGESDPAPLGESGRAERGGLRGGLRRGVNHDPIEIELWPSALQMAGQNSPPAQAAISDG